jgi:ribosome-associated protein
VNEPGPRLRRPAQEPAADDRNSAHTEAPPSKTQLKRQMHERQALGQRLAELNSEQLARLKLPEALLEAIGALRKISGNEARRRQMQYIGRLMRNVDYAAIHAAYDELLGGSRQAVALMHRCEDLRERLVEGDRALAEFVDARPGIDIQWLRAKVRAVRQERAASKAPRHARELYQWLHRTLQSDAGEPALEP